MPATSFISVTLLALLSSCSVSASPVSPPEGSNQAYLSSNSAIIPFPTHAIVDALSHSAHATIQSVPTSLASNPISVTSQAFHYTNDREPVKSSDNSAISLIETKLSAHHSSTTHANNQPTSTLSKPLLEARQTGAVTRQAPITIYGLYDALSNSRLEVQNAVGSGAPGSDSQRTGLAPLGQVFQVMTKQDPRLTGLPASRSITPMPTLSALETPTTSPESESMLAPLPTPSFSVTPPMFLSSIPTSTTPTTTAPQTTRTYIPNPGIGLVSIDPSRASVLLAAIQSHTSVTSPPSSSATTDPIPTGINDTNVAAPLPVSKVIILGCIIGGILFFTVCILIMFGGAGLCGCCRNVRKRGSQKGGKGIAGGLIYLPDDKSKRGSYALAHAMANGLAVGHGLALPNGKIIKEHSRPKSSSESKFGGLMSSLFAFRSRHNSVESAALHKSPSTTSFMLGDKSRPASRASRRGNAAELEGWTNLTPALILGPVPVIQAHAQAHLERRDRAREVVRRSGGSDHARDKGNFGVSEENREKPQKWEGSGPSKEETPQEMALQLLSTMKHGGKSAKKDMAKYNGRDGIPDRNGTAKSKFSVCSSQYSESSLSVIELYSSGDEDSDDEVGKISGLDEKDLSGDSANKSAGSAPQIARCASARVLSLPPIVGGVQWDLPNLNQDSLASSLGIRESPKQTTTSTQANNSPNRPPRPPRPPTADSPALSESVYLACSEVAYVLKCAGGGVLSEGEASEQDANTMLSMQPPVDPMADVSNGSAYSSSPTPNNTMVSSTSAVNPIAPLSVSASVQANVSAANTSASSANVSMGSQAATNTSTDTGNSAVPSRLKRTSRLLTGLASLANVTAPSTSSSGTLNKPERSRSSLFLNESGEYDRSIERLALARVPGAMGASDRFGDAGVSTMSYASYAQGQGYGHNQSQDRRSMTGGGPTQTPTRRPYHTPQTPPHSRSDGTISTEHARRSIQGYNSLVGHSNGYVQPHPYTYGPAAGYAYKPSRLSRIEGSPASISASAAMSNDGGSSVTAIGSSGATESSRSSPTPSPGLLRSLSSTSSSSTSTFDSKHARTHSEPAKRQDDNSKAPRVSFNLATLQMQSSAKQLSSSTAGNSSGSQNTTQQSEPGKRGGTSPRQKKKRSAPSYYHTDNEVDAGAESDIQEAVIRRIMKHRRSRSNSGWAYAGRGRR